VGYCAHLPPDQRQLFFPSPATIRITGFGFERIAVKMDRGFTVFIALPLQGQILVWEFTDFCFERKQVKVILAIPELPKSVLQTDGGSATLGGNRILKECQYVTDVPISSLLQSLPKTAFGRKWRVGSGAKLGSQTS
jgi:hypothetical protein